MNRAILFGNVGKDPDMKTLDSGKTITKFSLATNKSYKNSIGDKITDTSWHNIVLWGKVAEIAGKYIKKGSSVIIEGEITYRSYENNDGITIYTTEIIGKELTLVSSKKDDGVGEENWKGKKEVKSMSDVNDLPGYIDDGSIPDELGQPF